MKIELIDENKIKVILSCLDILNLNCDVSELFGETLSHELLDEILEKADSQLGFKAELSKIVVETLPSQTDGYIVFISKIEDDEIHRESEENAVIFSFSDYFSLKKGIYEIENIFYGSSTLFELDGRYFLFLNSVLKHNFTRAQVILTEFGEIVENSGVFISVLNEYGKMLFKKNAIKMVKNHIS